jgi:ferredoxin
MAYQITQKCISCDRCRPVCPTGAIQIQDNRYFINADLCNNCEGHYSVPQCRAACPANGGGCIPVFQDYWDWWFATYNRHLDRLKGTASEDYWERWSEVYSQKISALIHPAQATGA